MAAEQSEERKLKLTRARTNKERKKRKRFDSMDSIFGRRPASVEKEGAANANTSLESVGEVLY